MKNEKRIEVFTTGPEGWVDSPEGFLDKEMIKDAETGMVVNMTRYPKNYWKPKHVHSCAHGMYVIEGKLKTDDGVYGPGSFLWTPEGHVGGHGTTPDEDCLFLFITNKPFGIEFLD